MVRKVSSKKNGATNYIGREEILYTNYEAAYFSHNDKSNDYLKAVTYKFIKIKLSVFLFDTLFLINQQTLW